MEVYYLVHFSSKSFFSVRCLFLKHSSGMIGEMEKSVLSPASFFLTLINLTFPQKMITIMKTEIDFILVDYFETD